MGGSTMRCGLTLLRCRSPPILAVATHLDAAVPWILRGTKPRHARTELLARLAKIVEHA